MAVVVKVRERRHLAPCRQTHRRLPRAPLGKLVEWNDVQVNIWSTLPLCTSLCRWREVGGRNEQTQRCSNVEEEADKRIHVAYVDS